MLLGDAHFQAEAVEPAIEQYRSAVELEPGNIVSRIKLGEVLFRAGQVAEAEAEADTILAADAHNRFGLELKARVAREKGRLDEAQDVDASKAGTHNESDLAGFVRSVLVRIDHLSPLRSPNECFRIELRGF